MKKRDHDREVKAIRLAHERQIQTLTEDRDYWKREALNSREDYKEAVAELNKALTQ